MMLLNIMDFRRRHSPTRSDRLSVMMAATGVVFDKTSGSIGVVEKKLTRLWLPPPPGLSRIERGRGTSYREPVVNAYEQRVFRDRYIERLTCVAAARVLVSVLPSGRSNVVSAGATAGLLVFAAAGAAPRWWSGRGQGRHMD
jgi:hypothetical protein